RPPPEALQQAEHDRLPVGDRQRSAADYAAALRGRGPAERNQANTRHASPSRNEAIPCLTWWWFDPASWPGSHEGNDLAGSAQQTTARPSTTSARPPTPASQTRRRPRSTTAQLTGVESFIVG